MHSNGGEVVWRRSYAAGLGLGCASQPSQRPATPDSRPACQQPSRSDWATPHTARPSPGPPWQKIGLFWRPSQKFGVVNIPTVVLLVSAWGPKFFPATQDFFPRQSHRNTFFCCHYRGTRNIYCHCGRLLLKLPLFLFGASLGQRWRNRRLVCSGNGRVWGHRIGQRSLLAPGGPSDAECVDGL